MPLLKPWQAFCLAAGLGVVYGVLLYTFSMQHLALGTKGEKIAAAYLQKRHYTILGRNVRTWRGEIDLIARKGEDIVFIEVKARAHDDGWQPSERVDREKMKNLKRAAALWLEKQKMEDAPARIDIVGVCDGRVIEHFEDVTA